MEESETAPPTGQPTPLPLLEREEELATISAGLGVAGGGSGVTLVIEGEAGAGKTALLGAAAAMATGRGMQVLRGRGGEYERGFPYGVVRQLFEPSLVDPERRAELLRGTAAMAGAVFEPRTGEAIGDQHGSRHGLYWLLANLAEAGPVALLVDDAQWADVASLGALAYCGRRLDGLPVALVLTVRTGEPGTPAGLLGELRQAPAARRIVPPPLSADAAGALMAALGGRHPSRRLADACCSAAAGNPLLLVELLRGLGPLGAGLEEEGAERIAELAAAGVAGSIRTRLGRLGENAIEVARAVAILEPNAGVRGVASLAGLDGADVAAACERLIGANLLFDARPLGFVHPLVRAAVLSEMPAPSRAVAHSRAARLLAEEGAAADSVAAHLLLSEPAGEEWSVERLRAAATAALSRGAPDAAVRYLRRALREPPRERVAVAAELGTALLRDFDPEGIELLQAARDGSLDPAFRAELAATIATSLGLRVGGALAAAVLEESLAELGPGEELLRLRVRGHLMLLMLLGLERLPAGVLPEEGEEIPLDSTEGRMVAQHFAQLLVGGFGSVSRARELVEAATADLATVEADAMVGLPPQAAAVALTLADRGQGSSALCDLGIEAAVRRGALLGAPGNRGMRGLCNYLDGQLREAQGDLEYTLGVWDELGFGAARAVHVATATRILLARGEAAAAASLAEEARGEGERATGLPGALFRCARGELHLEAGNHAEARDDFLVAADKVAVVPLANPELIGWRGGLARAEAALGNEREARAVAAAAVELAREAGGERGLGVALRDQGVVADGEEAVALLRESASLLAPTRARHQHAMSLVELGAALRRANRRREAREPLREGLDAAHRCGAVSLEARAREELAATGARPRRAVLTGVDSLTASERRVARMAADGRTNREIAQALFVTPKTVETHLRHAYQKLGVARRTELPGALGGAPEGGAAGPP